MSTTTPLTWSEYVKLASRTESIPINHYSMLATTDTPCVDSPVFDKATRLLHAAMGLVTETQELSDFNGDRVNLIEELGDCFWYLPIIQDTLQHPLVGVVSPDPLGFDDCVANMKREAAELLNLIGKRHIFYGKPLEVEQVRNHTRNYLYWLMAACESIKVDITACWEANIKKLEKRYPKLRFDESDAVNRDTVNELSHILPGQGTPSVPEVGSVDAALAELDKIAEMPQVLEQADFRRILLTEVDYVKLPQMIAGWATTIAADYRDRECNALADGFYHAYRSILESWSPQYPEKILKDAWELYIHMVENDLPNGSLYLEEFTKWVKA